MTKALAVIGALLMALALAACGLHLANSGTSPVPDRPPGAWRVATHNVHYILLRRPEGSWSVADWERRRPALDAAFKAIEADIFAFQEMESFAGGDDASVNLALDYLLERNPDYAAAAVGDWRRFPSTQPILYRKGRLRLVDQGWFFFSETPDVIYSRTFDGSYPAFASWAAFVPEEGGPEVHVLNVHLDYSSRTNRARSVALVRERVAGLLEAGRTVILLGDLNERAGSDVHRSLEQAGLRFAPVEGATYHFNRGINLFGAIDHVATTADVELVGEPVVLRQRFGGAWPSDHYPVVADVRLP
ncbi:endonuclease/exonuclease/phosphatase family protein [Rhodobacteraceae bacterium MCCB 386]|nr:endonuclease/exonuclease/phosphatase family protein [Roseitranquillus sediminis]